jgi:hypothetical protein
MSTTPAPDPGTAKPGEVVTAKNENFQIVLLGPKTVPPAIEPDRFLRIATDMAPLAVSNDAIMRIVMQVKNQFKAVELVITRDSNMEGMGQVDSLRDRVLKEAQLPFVQPDPQDPLGNKREVFAPPNKKD